MFARGPKMVDMLEELRESLRGYIESDKRLEEYLSAVGQSFVLRNPWTVARRIKEDYRGGRLCVRDFIQTACVRGPEVRHFRVAEAEQCIALALEEVYGIKAHPVERATAFDHATFRLIGTPTETDEEKEFKRELRFVFMAGAVRKEIFALKGHIAHVAFNQGTYPALKEYVSATNFERRVRPLVVALELEALPARPVVERVERFLNALYRRADALIAREEAGRTAEQSVTAPEAKK